MNQRTLFDDDSVRGMHRRSDPVTSRIAAVEVLVSGRADNQRQAVLAIVQRHNGLTSAEIGRLLDMPGARHVAGRRLPELERLGLVHKGQRRTCGANGTQAVTWWLTLR